MRRQSPFVDLLVASACSVASCAVDLEVPAGGRVTCADDAHCPTEQRCHPVRQVCEVPGFDAALPRPVLVFSVPAAGDVDVVLDPDVVLAFSIGVDPASVAEHTTLAGLDGAVGLLLLDDLSVDNALRFALARPLEPLQRYTFTLAPGIAPRDAQTAAPTDVAFTAQFDTAAAPDRQGPAPVSALRVDYRDLARVTATWTSPTDADFAGVLVVRKRGLISERPEAGVAYAAGARLGAGEDAAEVVAVTRAGSWIDVTGGAAPLAYAAFAFDEHNNYSDSRSPPYVEALSVSWCPDERGALSIAAVGAGEQQIFAASAAGGDGVELAAGVLGAQTPLDAGAAVALGETVYLRVEARGLDGSASVSVEQVWTASRGVPPIIAQPLGVMPGGHATLAVAPDGWSAFEVQADTAPLAGLEQWSAAPGAAPGGLASAPMPSAGVFRLRVRPAEPSCAAGAWSTSDEFAVGDFRYVIAGGRGDTTGRDPANAMATITAALASVGPGSDVFVAAGEYPEIVVLEPAVRLLGGYREDFLARDPSAFVSAIRPAATQAVVASGSAVDSASVLDGFTLEPLATTLDDTTGVTITDGAGPTLRGCVIHGGSPIGFSSHGVLLRAAGAVLVENCRIDGGNSASKRSGVWALFAPTRLTLRGNHIRASEGVRYETDVDAVIEDNTIEDDGLGATWSGLTCVSAGTGGIARNRILGGHPRAVEIWTGILVQECGAHVIEGNVVGSAAQKSFVGYWSGAVAVSSADDVVVRNNVLDGGHALFSTAALRCLTASTLVVANNVLTAGVGPAQYLAGIEVGTGCTVTVVNNIFAGQEGAYDALRADPSGSTVASLQHNAFLSVPARYWNTYPSVGGVGAAIDALEATACGAGIRTAGNRLVSATPVFVDPTGPDGDPLTLADNVYALATDDPALGEGGIDAGNDSCGAGGCSGSGAQSCGDVVLDAAGATRTVPYSIGPYERD